MKKLTLVFSLLLIFMELLWISYFSYNDFMALQLLMSNNLQSSNAVSVAFKEDSYIPKLAKLYDENITIFSEVYKNECFTVIGVYGKIHSLHEYNSIILGDLFLEPDFSHDIPKAIVGKNILQNKNLYLTDTNGNSFIEIAGSKYEVIGQIDPSISDMLNNTIFINLYEQEETPQTIIIDCKDNNLLDNYVANLNKNYQINIYKENNNFIQRYIFDRSDKSVLDLLVLIFSIVLTASITMIYVLGHRDEVIVKKIIGVNRKTILLELISRLVVLFLSNTIVIVFIYNIIYQLMIRKYHLILNTYNLLIVVTIDICIICIALILYIYGLNKHFDKYGVK